METPRGRMLEILEDLGDEELKLLQWYLQQPTDLEGLRPIPVSFLQNANRMQTVDLIVQKYASNADQILKKVLEEISRKDLVERYLETPNGQSPELPSSPRPASAVSGRKRKRMMRHALTGEEKARREREAKLRGLLETVERTSGYEDQLQDNMKSTHLSVRLGTLEVEFEDVFIWLYNVDIKDTDIHSHHEVRQMENKPGERTLIQLIEMHKDRSGRDIRTVLTVGCAGIGKTFLVHKFLSDWSRKCFPQDPHLVFPLRFRQLNLLKGKKFRLAQLIHHCIKETKFIEEDILNDIFNELQKSVDYNKSPFKVMIVMDGYDEHNFQFDFETDFGPMNLVDSYPVEHLLVNLIKEVLLPAAHLWITSRPAAAKQIPKAFVKRMTEVRGFIRDDQKKEYFKKMFMKIFNDENKANSMASSIYSHIKTSKILHNMCEIPVFCSFLARVVQNKPTTELHKLPKTMVELFCHFLMGETQREKMKNTSLGEEKEKLIKDAGDVLLKLGKLAFDQLDKGKIIFYEEDLKACGLDVNKDMLISDFCTTFFKEDDVYFQQTVYCFVHLSIQEFLGAVYLFHCFTQWNSSSWFHRFTQRRNREVLETFLGTRVGSLEDFLKRAMQKALRSENGHLDLFIRFLHGLSLESNQSLLGGLLGQTENSSKEIQRAINNLKEMSANEDLSPDGCINIFHCLMEMNDPSVSQVIQQYLESTSRTGKELSETQCSDLASMLLMSERVLEELDLDKYNTDRRGRERLVPAVRNCTTARLVGFGRALRKEHIEGVASALTSNPSHLRHLDLSSNHLDTNLDLLCQALKSPNCRLVTLRLMNCWLSERNCELLASALRSNPHLRELDLTFNVLTVSGLKNFSGLETLKVKHGAHEHWTNPQLLLTQSSHPLALDPNTASRTLRLSDDNTEVTWSRELRPYADHEDRFDDKCKQVLCTEGLIGRRYLWEAECSGGVLIGAAHRPIGKRGEGSWLGFNARSWSLESCGGCYSVIHGGRTTYLPVGLPDSHRVWVHLDWPAGTLSFYDASSGSPRHLYTFQTTLTEALYPGFRVTADSSVRLL